MDYYDIQHTTNVVASCVVLHNICEDICQHERIHSTDESKNSAPEPPPAVATRSRD